MKLLRKNLVWTCYFLTLLILLLDTLNSITVTEVLRLIKYPFLAYIIFENITYVGLKRIYLYPTVFIGLILVHTFLFGLVITNPIVESGTFYNFYQLLVLLMLAFFMARYCYYTNTEKEFIITSFFAHFIFIAFAYITNLNGLAPIRYLLTLPKLILSQARFGYTFGTGFRSMIGHYASIALILVAFLWIFRNEFKGYLKKCHQILFFGATVLFIFVLVSSTSRSEILSSILFYMVVAFMKWRDNAKMTKFTKVMFFILVAVVVVVGLYLVLKESFAIDSISNRTNNWTMNIQAFSEHGKPWTGLGYSEVHDFLSRAYGYETWPCDVYYLYIFFSTGILGSLIMGAAFVWLTIIILTNKTENRNYDILMKAFTIAMLFNNIYHATVISYNYISSIVTLILLILQLYKTNAYKEKLRLKEDYDE